MKLSQKFFGFILLPLLTFVLGFSLAGKSGALPGQGTENTSGTTSLNGSSIAKNIDLQIFEVALQKWQDASSGTDAAQIEKFKKTLSQVQQLVAHSGQVNLNTFWETLGKIQDKYVDPEKIDLSKAGEGAVRGLVQSLGDPYSMYLSKEESQEFDDELSGILEGVGAELTIKNNFVTVVSPLKDSPAAKAGILPDDVVMKVNGTDLTGLSLSEVVKKIRGPEGTKVTLSVVHKNSPNPVDVEIMRQHIVIESVSLEMRDSIAILTVNQFGDHTTDEFTKYLRQALSESPRGIILDLRFNPGGYLESAVDMVSAFVGQGKVVIEQERAKKMTSEFVTGKTITDLPVIVLINKGSASAAEIVAGALQDHERAIILGEQSFGKGTVQELVPLTDGSNLRLTVAKWLTPNGRSISAVGITPDIAIERTSQDFEQNKDPQLDAAFKLLKGEAKKEDFLKPKK